MRLEISQMPTAINSMRIWPWHKIKNIKAKDLDPIEVSVASFQETVWRMVKTCLEDDGIGLAGPQVGIFKKIMICREAKSNGDDNKFEIMESFKAYINPSFEPFIENGKNEAVEYCLSVPERGFKITRWTTIKASWHEVLENRTTLLEKKTAILQNFQARLFQHEFDHLNGISIPQRWDLQKKKPKPKRKKKTKK